MNFIARFLLILILSSLCGALTAPWVYNSLVAWGVTSFPFDKVLNRSVLGCLILFLILFRKRLFTLSVEQLGLTRTRGWKQDLLYGILFGTLSLALLNIIFYFFDARLFDNRLFTEKYLKKAVEYGASALFIGTFEEIFFRGFVLQGFLQTQKRWVAVTLSSLFYAVTHFLKPDSFVVEGKASILFSLQSLLKFIEPLADFDDVLPYFFGLFLLGLILAYARLKTGRLYFSIALHGIWVYWIKIDSALIRPTYLGGEHWFFGDGKVINGFCGWFFLLAVLLWIYYFVPLKRNKTVVEMK